LIDPTRGNVAGKAAAIPLQIDGKGSFYENFFIESGENLLNRRRKVNS